MTATIPTFKTWKTVKLGGSIRTGGAFCKAIEEEGCIIGGAGRTILAHPSFQMSAEATEVELVRVSVSELGVERGEHVKSLGLDQYYQDKIQERAQELGLDLCSAEVGPQLLLQYKDQTKGEKLLIGMKPVDCNGYHYIFSVYHYKDDDDQNEDVRTLNGVCGNPAQIYSSKDLWVFIKRLN